MNQIPMASTCSTSWPPRPHQPPGYHYQSLQVYHHHVCCWQLSLAGFLLEEKSWSYGSWDVGEKKIYTETEMGFCWGIGEILSSNQINFKSGKFRFPSSQGSREGGFVYLAIARKYCPPNSWMIGILNMIHKICGPNNQCTYEFGSHRHIVYN